MKSRKKVGIIQLSSDLKLYISTHNNASKHIQKLQHENKAGGNLLSVLWRKYKRKFI